VLTTGQNYTLTSAQAAIAKIGTGGTAGTLTDSGTMTLKAAATGEDLSGVTATGIDSIVLTTAQNYTLTLAQAAIAKIGTGGTAGTLSDSGVTTIKLATTGLAGAGILADGTLTSPKVITGLAAGDKIDLSGFAPASLKSISAANDGTAYLADAVTGGAALVKGTYTSGSFAVDGTGADELFVYDTNGTNVGGLEAIVLIGSNAGIASFSSDSSGIFTFA
jgi:hypothetical protein